MIRLTRWNTLPVLAVMCLLSTAASCPQTQNRTTEGVLADYGGRIAKTVGQAQEAVGAVGKASTVPAVKQAALDALAGLQLVNDKGTQLADTLDVIVKARAAGGPVDANTLARALALVDAIDTDLLKQVVPKLGSPEAGAALDLVRAVSKLILNIQLELGKASVS